MIYPKSSATKEVTEQQSRLFRSLVQREVAIVNEMDPGYCITCERCLEVLGSFQSAMARRVNEGGKDPEVQGTLSNEF